MLKVRQGLCTLSQILTHYYTPVVSTLRQSTLNSSVLVRFQAKRNLTGRTCGFGFRTRNITTSNVPQILHTLRPMLVLYLYILLPTLPRGNVIKDNYCLTAARACSSASLIIGRRNRNKTNNNAAEKSEEATSIAKKLACGKVSQNPPISPDR